ncbi:dTDP-4-amino-4,6-dideoxygalactose transaminase [bacterium]|nr:dTDP-4-amino-4,6-dideoxygalactose transaminase [bacterium]
MSTFNSKIPFSKPALGESDIEALIQAARSGSIGGNGAITKELHTAFSKLYPASHSIPTTSCSDALELSMESLRIGPGDEVIVPSFSFPSTANAVVRERANCVFADIKQDDLNIDPQHIESLITSRTRGILVVHYAGVSCDMDAIRQIAKKHGLFVVEDAAQGIGAFWGDEPLGLVSDAGCISFHVTKNLGCGEGGVFLTRDQGLFHTAEIIAEKGTNRAAFIRGQVDKYTWVDIGSSYILSDLLGALLLSQLKRVKEITDDRLHTWEWYRQQLADLSRSGEVQLVKPHAKAIHNGHIFYVLLDPQRRDSILDYMQKNQVQATTHYQPLHASPFARREIYSGKTVPSLPITELVAQSILRFPIYANMTQAEKERVVEVFLQALKET